MSILKKVKVTNSDDDAAACVSTSLSTQTSMSNPYAEDLGEGPSSQRGEVESGDGGKGKGKTSSAKGKGKGKGKKSYVPSPFLSIIILIALINGSLCEQLDEEEGEPSEASKKIYYFIAFMK